MKKEDIAKVCHEVNKAYCESIGDTSQLIWGAAAQWQRDSAINGVDFHLQFPKAGINRSHNKWMKEKVDNGWVYGTKKDESLKTHPCIVPYSYLPTEQQAKDYIFRSIVHELSHYIDNE